MSGSMRGFMLLFVAAGLAFAQTARFPGAVATDQDLLTAIDNAFSQLAAPIPDATSLSITVNSGDSFGGKTNFSVTIEGEQVLICSVSGNTLTVCPGGRGFAGTTAAAHPAGVAVRGNNTAWHHNAQSAEIKAVETALGANLSNVEKSLTFSSPLSRSTNAVSCPACVITSGNYADPEWLTISKAKLGLGAVENTALSTWPGSTNLTTLGTLTVLTTANTPGNGQFTLKNGAIDRWKLGLDGAESGSNAGSELSFWGYADDGTFLGRWLALSRAGRVTYYGDTIYGADNSYDIGAAGANRPRTIYAATSLVAPMYSGGTEGTARARYGAIANNVPRADFGFNTSFSDPSWVRDDTAKSAALFALWDGHADMYVAPAGTGAITWNNAFAILPDGQISIPKRHQQINVTLYDPNTAIPAGTIWNVWRAEYGSADITSISCTADTNDAVVNIQNSGSVNLIASNLACSNSAWVSQTTLQNATVAVGNGIGIVVVSGTAKRINFSLKYTGN